MKASRVTVRVPATSANLGPGFDCLGMALKLFNTITVEISQELNIEISGEGSDSLSKGADNLVYHSASALYEAIGDAAPKLEICCDNQIPLARGLGSSAAAVVGGLVAGNALAGEPLSRDKLLELATGLEGHPDNVAPALLGGCQIVVKDGDSIVTSRVPVSQGIKAVVFIPDFPMSTKEARKVLPETYSRADAVFNSGRAAMLVNALTHGRFDRLRVATQDRLHQPYRATIFPQMSSIFDGALAAGALGVFLSGAGSSVLALARRSEEDAVETAMTRAAQGAGVTGKSMVCSIWPRGAEVLAGHSAEPIKA